VYKQSAEGNQEPDPFDLQNPENGTTLNASVGVGFGWSVAYDPDGDPVTYTLEVRTGDWSNNTGLYKIDGLTRTAMLVNPDSGFSDGLSYSWRVSAVDQYGAVRHSAIWNFTADNQNAVIPGFIEGYVIDADTQQPIANVTIQATPFLAISIADNGYYLGFGVPRDYVFNLIATGYNAQVYTDIAVLEGDVVTRDFELLPIPQQAAIPEFSPVPQSFNTAQLVTITCSSEGALIYYTTNGIDPTESATLYPAPIELTESTTIKARAYLADHAPSEIAVGQFDIYVDGGDANWDGEVNLADAILTLQTITGVDGGDTENRSDVNGDNRVGLEEIIYILQRIVEIRD